MSVSGKFLTAKLGNAAVAAAYSWSVDEKADELDATSNLTAGFTDTDTGPQDARVTINWYIDVATGVYAALCAGAVLTDLKLYRVSTDTSPAYLFPAAVVLSSQQKGEVRGRIEGTCTVANKGSFTRAEPGT